MRSKFTAFGLSFFVGDYKDLEVEVLNRCKGPRKSIVATPNADFVVRYERDKEFREVLDSFDILTVDGFPLILACRIKKVFGHYGAVSAKVNRITGASITPRLTVSGIQRGLRVAYVGGLPGVAENACANIVEKYDLDANNIIHICPPFGFENDLMENEKLIKKINDFKPHLLFLGVGSPKQENWLVSNKDKLCFHVGFGVGASFDFIAGTKSRAPVAIQNLGMEWIWRLIQEPRRLGKRYLKIIPTFFVIFIKECFKKEL